MRVSIDTLRRFSLFSGLEDEQLEKISSEMQTVHKSKQTHVVVEGESGEELFILLDGELEITKRLVLQGAGEPETKEKSLIRLKASANVFFGELSIYDGGARSASVTALTDVTLGILSRSQVENLCREDPALGFKLFYNIGKKVAADLRKANRDVLKLTTAFVLALEGK